MRRGRDSVHTVVEEEKRGNTISMQTHCFLGGAMPVGPLMPHARGKHGPRLALGILEKTNTRIFRCSPLGTYPQRWRLFLVLFFDAVALPKAVHRDVSCLRTANSEYIWKNAVAFLPNTLRAGTRTLFSFQGAVELFSQGEEKPEMYRLKPEAPNHWD
jgi:hypothetical protein